MIDCVIPLGNGSNYNDIELRFCLRSIEKHLKGYGKIYIVGERPEWLQNIIHTPFKDIPFWENRSRNIYNKVLAACERVGEEFLFFNDDHFLLQDIEAKEFPYHHKGLLTLEGRKKGDSYGKLLSNTLKRFPGTNNYDTHAPILYNRDKFANLNIPEVPFGFGIKTYYCAIYGIEGEYYPDCKISNKEEIYKQIEGRMYFSISDKAFPVIKEVLNELYPQKSSFEH